MSNLGSTADNIASKADALKGMGIAITRPLGQAKKLAAAINGAGGTPIFFPLIEIAPLADYSEFENTLSHLEYADWAIFISTNAVDNAMPHLLKHYPQLPAKLKFAAIGPQTAQQLALYGVHEVLTPLMRFDSEALLALSEMQHMANKRVMIFRGVGGREVLADSLKARGAKVTFAECYRRVNPQNDCQLLEDLWQKHACHAIVVTSSEAMRHLIKMTHHGSADWLRNIKICVNHARIAEEAGVTGLNLYVADAPGDEAMLACLKTALTGTSQ